MSDENELQSSAENEEVSSEVVETPQTGESDTPQETETEEQKNERAVQEDAARKQAREEKRQASVQRRMDELTAQRYTEKARADLLQAELERLRSPAPQAKNAGEPQRDQFDSYEDYLEAKVTYKAEQIAKQHVEQFQTEQKKTANVTAAEQSRKESERQFLERRNALEKELPDYKDVIEDWEPNLPPSVVETIIKLPQGPLISYHLAKNPALEAQFRDQPDYMHGVLIGQLLATLNTAPKVTAAPAPGKPVSSSKAAAGTQPPSDPNQYYAWAQKNLR